MMSNNIIKNQIDAYRRNFLKHESSPLGTYQNDLVTMRERHKQVLEPLLRVRPEGFSICDVGSGVCDLHKYLKDLGVEHSYTGIEIVPEMVSRARELHTTARVLNLDFLDNSFDECFDFVVLSGTFNLPGQTPADQWEQFIFDMITQMYDRAKIGIAFNALTTYTSFRSDQLFYLEPERVLSFIQSRLSRFCALNSAYPLFEVTYTVFKPEGVREVFPDLEFQKYF